MVESTPVVSVIVTAHSRTTYLMDALTSVLQQTFSRDEFELIVAKNFTDLVLDEFIKEIDAKALFTPETEMGRQLVRAISVARGKYLCFLDDDDVWEPGKLSWTVAQFESNPSLSYLGHTQSPMSSTGARAITGNRGVRARLASLADGSVHLIDLARESPRGLINLFRTNPANSSSIAVRASSLSRFWSYLGRLDYGPDHFMLAAGLLSGGRVAICHVPFTRLRINTGFHRPTPDASFSHEIRRLITLAERAERGNDLLIQMSTETGVAALTEALEARGEFIGLIKDILIGEQSWGERSLAMVRVISNLRRLREKPVWDWNVVFPQGAFTLLPPSGRVFCYLAETRRRSEYD